MRKIFFITLAVTLIGFHGWSQQKVTVRLNNRPMAELFEAIKKQTEYRIYCTPNVADSLRVTLSETDAEPVELIRKALVGSSFQASVFQNEVYIVKDRMLITTLPDNFYGRTVSESAPVTPQFERDKKAVSETVVYAIGNQNAPAATSVTISGIVTDFKTGDPMPGISLHSEDPFVGTVTDGNGAYSLRLPPGRRELIIRSMGMKESKRQLMIFSDGKLDVEVEEQIYSLAEVSVIVNRTDNIRSISGGVERLQMKSIKNVPTIMGQADVLRIIMTLPGVKSAGEISSGFNVRGGATDQNLILFNEGTVFMPNHMFGLFSALNPDMVENMELYKSIIPAKYGGRISSVLEINAKEGNKKAIQGTASIGLLTSGVAIDGPLFNGKGSFIAGGRTTYSDWMLKMIPDDSEYKNGTAGFYDLNAALNYHFNERNNLYVSGYYSRDRFNFSNANEYSYQNANFSAKWKHIFSPQLTGSFVVGADHYSYSNWDKLDTISGYKLDYAINQQYGKIDFSFYGLTNHTVNFGVNTLLYQLTPGNYYPYGDKSTVKKDAIQTEKALESAVYLSDEWKMSDKWMAGIGLRYSMFNALGPRNYTIYSPDYLPSLETAIRNEEVDGGVFKTYHGPEYRLSLRYILNDKTSIKGGVSSARQYIHKISNTTLMSPTDTWKLSDANIRPQFGTHYTIGLFRNFANNTIETSIEAYYKSIDDYLDYRGGAELLMNHHIETEVAGTKGKAYGLELMVKKTQGKLNGWVSYVYSRSLMQMSNELITSSKLNKWYPTDYDKPHEMKFVGNYKFTHRYSLSLNCDYSTGRPITIPVSKYVYEGQQYVFYTERNQHRIPDFFRVDLSFNIEAGHRLTKLTQSYFTFGIYNLTGRNNAYSVYYQMDDFGRIRGYQLSIFGVPIPYISYNIKFENRRK